MDLRKYRLTPEQLSAATQYLRYQPFILDDQRHCGVAYSWLYYNDPTTATIETLFFDRRVVSADVWDKAYDANLRLQSMYDAFISKIVEVCPADGSYLDVGCNTGYFPIAASLAGIRNAVGIDIGDFSHGFQLLKQITGSSAVFSIGGYDPAAQRLNLGELSGQQKFDVVSSCALLCHISNPLHFLKALAEAATKAIFLWSGFIDSDELVIRYNPPDKFSKAEFPDCFDDGTSISHGLLRLAMAKLGFANFEELETKPDWLAADWHARRMPQYQRFRAFLFWR
jgi:SAM-dependent methyltransferase